MGGSDSFKKDNIASKLIVEDHLKSMLAKSQNTNYKPWKNDQAPKNPHSPFGDFPKTHITKVASPSKLDQVHETSHATTKQKTVTSVGQGIGGQSTSLQQKKQVFSPPSQVSGAFDKRSITL